MAQAKVTDWFQVKKRKRNNDFDGFHSSKRAKIHQESAEPRTEPVKTPKPVEKKPGVDVQSSRKNAKPPLNVQSAREKLAKSGNLKELQKRLGQFSEAAAKVQKARENKSQIVENVPSKEPAYIRFQRLAEPVSALTLPPHYKRLAECFNSVDDVLGMLTNRQEMCTFDKLKQSVQNMMKKKFEEKHLGQIKTVYPTALKFRQEKNLPSFAKKSHGYQLTITPDLSDVTDEAEQKANNGYVQMTIAKKLKRKRIFLNLLTQVVKEHHKEFLSTLDPPLTVPDDKLTKWHQQFELDRVPPIEPAEIPQPPAVNQIRTAAEALEVARTQPTPKLTPRVKKSLEAVSRDSASKTARQLFTDDSSKVSPQKVLSSAKPEAPSPSLKGVPDSLWQRIRAKEAAKKVKLMTRPPEQEKRIQMLERLPQVGRLVSTHFTTKGKDCLRLDEIVMKVTDKWTHMGQNEAEAHAKMLVEVLPEWACIHTIRNVGYLKIVDKSKNNLIYMEDKLKKKLDEEKSK